ncbi:Bicyclomycin resistance protein [Lacunisphaera limnophila]|uniref:Bicyclomycin resistance protein n=1 Tax=Lacunisphaera limnophila TaxID=1838286 RepID=A0A1D8AR26_9BACT|nr:multidrug effflux MFS transporter [Lacunisphaera limnophila]AOS43338.1 Bicyclomycin resistance protein [Lacunisphaera limnophila]
MAETNPSASAPQPVPPLRQPGRGLVFILGALTVIGPFAVDMYLPALPAIGLDLGTDVGAVQQTLSIYLLGLAAGQACLGPIVDRWGRRGPLLVGLAFFVLASVGCALAESMAALLAWRLVMALGAAASMVVPRAVVRDHFNETDSAKMYSLLMVILSVSPVFAPSVGGLFLDWTGWRGIFWMLVGLGLACAAAVFWSLPETARRTPPASGGIGQAFRTYGRLLRDRRFIGPALVAGFMVGAVFCYLAGSAFVLIELHGLSPKQYALAFGFVGLALIFASQLNRLLLRRFALRAILNGTLVGLALVGLALLVTGVTGWGGLPLLLVLLFLNLSAGGLISPNIAAIVMAPFGEVAGSASALLGTIQFGVGAGAGAVVGWLHDGTARPMTGMMAACAFASGVVWWTMGRTRGRQAE